MKLLQNLNVGWISAVSSTNIPMCVKGGWRSLSTPLLIMTTLFLQTTYAAPALPPLVPEGENLSDYPDMPKELADVIRPSSWLNTVTFSPNGKFFASASSDGTVDLWDFKNYHLIHSFKKRHHETGSREVSSVAFSPDSKILASGSYDGIIELWNVDTKEYIHSFKGSQYDLKLSNNDSKLPLPTDISDNTNISAPSNSLSKLSIPAASNSNINAIAFSPDGSMLASASWGGTIKLWDIKKRRLIYSYVIHKQWVNSLEFSPDGETLASASSDNTLKLWDIKKRTLIHSFEGSEQGGLTSVAFSPNGKTIASSNGTLIKLWNIKNKAPITSYKGHKEWATTVAFSPDGRMLASGSQDNTVRLWDIQNNSLIKVFQQRKVHGEYGIQSLAFSPNGRILASVSADLTVKLWDTQSMSEVSSVGGQKYITDGVAFSPDGQMIATTSSFDDTIQLWDINKHKLIHSFEGHKDLVLSLVFSPNGKIIASSSYDKTIKLWNIQTKSLIYSFEGQSSAVTSPTFSPDGSLIASAFDDKTIKIWDVQSKSLITSYSENKDFVESVAFHPGRKLIASVSTSGTIKLWNIQDNSLIESIKDHNGVIGPISFSADGKVLLTTSRGSIKHWNTQNLSLIRSIDGLIGDSYPGSYSSDKKIFSSISDDGSIMLWDLSKELPIYSFEGHKTSFNWQVAIGPTAVLSPDKKLLASTNRDGVIKLWDVQKQTLKYDLIRGNSNNWLWQDRQTGQFWRGDNGTLLLQPNKGYLPLPPPQIANKDQLLIKPVQQSFTLESGVVSELELDIENMGDTPVWWIHTIQTDNKHFVVYPIRHQHLDSHQSIRLKVPVSVHVSETPKPFDSTLTFELMTATGDRFPVSIPVIVQTPDLEWQEASLLEDKKTLKLSLINQGEQAIPKASFRLSGFADQLKIEENLLPKEVRDLTFSLPENTRLNKDSKITLNGWTSSLPLFKWEFADKPITLPRPAWQLYLALMTLLMFIAGATFHLLRYRHPLLVQLSTEPDTLLKVPPEQLLEAQQRLLQTRRLQKILTDAQVSEHTLNGALAFVDKGNNGKDSPDSVNSIRATQRAEWLAQRLGSPIVPLDNGLFRLNLNAQFPLNVDQCLLFFPPDSMAAVDALNHLKSIPDAGHIVTLVMGDNSDYQRELRRKTLDVGNKWVAPDGASLTELLLSPEPESVLARIIAEQIPLTQISPYQLGGGTTREAMFFGRKEMVAHIMNRDPANYLLVAGRQLGKSTLLKALERRYQDHAQVRCFYRALADEKLEPQLARALRLPGKPSLDEIVEHLEQLIEQDKRHYLFLIDEADTFIRYERATEYKILNTLRQLSEAGQCSFILAGFWHLYDYSVLDYQSPLKNFGEVLQLGALEQEACWQLATVPMQNMGIRYAADGLVDELIEQTGQRANLISISCNEILKQLGKEQRVIEAGDIHRALKSDPITRALEGWKNLSGVAEDDRIDRIIVYVMIPREQFTLSALDTVIKEKGFNVPISNLERSLARLELAFILQRDGKHYSWRVPLFCSRLREQELEIRLMGELEI